MTALEALLRRERAVLAGGLALLTLLAWWYVWLGAGTGMSATAMSRLVLFPHMYAAPTTAPTMNMEPPHLAWALAIAMWWVMMVAMMLPSAAPLVLLYGRALRHNRADAHPGTVYAPSAFLTAGYLAVWLAVWLAFSIAAATLQSVFEPAGLLSATTYGGPAVPRSRR